MVEAPLGFLHVSRFAVLAGLGGNEHVLGGRATMTPIDGSVSCRGRFDREVKVEVSPESQQDGPNRREADGEGACPYHV